MERVLVEDVLGRNSFPGYDTNIYMATKQRWDRIAKPLDSMGQFEKIHSKMAAISGVDNPSASKCALLVFCADNGVVAQNVSQSGQEVTAICAKSIACRKSCAGIIANANDIHVTVIDVGINADMSCMSDTKALTQEVGNDADFRHNKIMMGTRDFSVEPAMSTEEALSAIQIGMDFVKEYKELGYDLLITGEMGIGNTTTSAAVASAILDVDSDLITGRGAGLDDARLARKKMVIRESIEKYNLRSSDALTILSTVGGLDIAALAGVCLGANAYHIPVVLDGVISMVSALVAEKLVAGTTSHLIASHISKEPAAAIISGAINMEPVISADMALGEGSGGVMLVPLLRTVIEVFDKSASFEDIKVEQYERNS